jgi:hypothetical protein
MASFSAKKYFRKIYSPSLLTKYYESHGIEMLFPVLEGTPRKNVVNMMIEGYNSLSPEKKIDISKELAIIDQVSSKHTIALFPHILNENKAKNKEELETTSDADKVLSFYLYHKDLFSEVLFYNDFYKTKSYMMYEAPEIDVKQAQFNTTEFTKELNRIINTDERATECDVTAKSLDGLLYVYAAFEGAPEADPSKNHETGQIDRTKTARKLQHVRFVYLPKDKEALISYTGSRYEKTIFLDTFLRIVCEGKGYEDKEESFDLSRLQDDNFDFSNVKKDLPLLTWKIKGVTLSFGGNEKFRKRMRISIPSAAHEHGLAPLLTTLEDLKLGSAYKTFKIENATFMFSFTDKNAGDKNVNVPCTVSLIRSSLCSLFPYDRYAKSLLKYADIDLGFVEKSTKEKQALDKKWEA